MEAVFDKVAINRFRRRAQRIADHGAAFLLERASAELGERLSMVERTFANAANASGNAALINPLTHAPVKTLAAADGWVGRDEENLSDLPGAQDLIVSLLSLHEVDDVPGALVQMRQRLKPDGLFMGVMPGAGTLGELRECLLAAETEITGGASPRVYPFADVRTAGGLLQRAGLALPVADQETITVRYRDMIALMRDLRAMGAVNALLARSRIPLRRDVLVMAAALYAERFAGADGKIPATFNFIWMSGWAPSQAQQKPARRGSATKSLEAALKDIEAKR